MAALSGAVHWHKTTDHMTIRPIVRYPDPRLALPAQPVTVFDGALRDLARDLLETMHAAPGIGITAPLWRGRLARRHRALSARPFTSTMPTCRRVQASACRLARGSIAGCMFSTARSRSHTNKPKRIRR
jgi:hypothetical protein